MVEERGDGGLASQLEVTLSPSCDLERLLNLFSLASQLMSAITPMSQDCCGTGYDE